MKTNKGKRLLSRILSLAMILSLVPAMNLVPKAAAAEIDEASYVTMPITIRDYAADGMLFEFNQVGATGTVVTGSPSTYTCVVNPSAWSVDNYTGIRICTYGEDVWTDTNLYWHCIICDSTGNIIKVLPSGTVKPDEYNSIMKSGYYAVWVWNPGSASADYTAMAAITEANKDNYTITYSGTTLSVNTKGDGGTYKQGDTAGFSLLSTGSADYINNLPSDESQTIAETDLILNGTWGLKTDPDPITATLNSGASQQVYGAWIRTNLVQPALVNGKMVYTEATVKYLAEYMQQIMAVPEQNSDGSYNTYFVTGDELDELGGETLAAKIRAQVTNNDLGVYADAKEKYDDGKLSDYTGITTWYDAAYFLLHNTFDDSTGYGKTIDAYKNLHLVQTTNDAGEVCYVFNSKYDDTKYDYANGEIYNTQTDTYTIAKTDSGTETYVRGNPLPEDRFDPLGPSGTGNNYGYGMSGDTYGDMITESTADWNTFYDNTNYNLSLEGHAQFIYYEDDDLYFTFTGDDDVYLFVNGIRVLDVGAAHSISKVKINLNDVAQLCGLKDGEAYDFDFFYMERHGTAANFGIETNIKIVDPAMLTNKTGYQNGVSTGYNGYVDPNKKVGYSFELTNNGEAKIEDLTFTDDDIGVTFTKETITLNSDSNINEMYAYLYNRDGTIKKSYMAESLTEDILKNLLAEGLEVGEKIGIYGFKYQIPEDKWVNDTFPNTVYTTAVVVGANSGTQTLNGIADWKVQKSSLVTEPFHVYDWVTKDVSKDPETVCKWYSPEGASVTVTKQELIQSIIDAGKKVEVDDNVSIVLCSASGNEGSVNINTNATVNNDGGITYTSTEPGVDTVYYKVKGINYDTMVFNYDVYTYGTVNNVYVLDYGLAVELNGDDFGLMANDYLTMAQNPNAVTASVTGTEKPTENYGKFTWEDPSLKYTPDKIINDTDSVTVNVQILEKDAAELTKFTGVNMSETVTTAPASVVYYEENFPGITYVNKDGNEWVRYETVDKDGNSTAGTEQSADQDSNYGSDPNYEEDKVGETALADDEDDETTQTDDGVDETTLTTNSALGGSDSNGTVHELEVKTTAEVMYFDFVGTGFEIVSRTTTEKYAVVNVEVQRVNNDETYTTVKQKPVITESKGGDLYQIPIISITGLERGKYRVVVKSAGSTDAKTRVLYLDGLRIYDPLDGKDCLRFYNSEEYYADIYEVKQLIQNGQMIYADASETDDDLQLVTGTTLVEDVDGDMLLEAIESVEDYMLVGPNNELYLDGNAATGMIAFFLTPDEDIPATARTIEIGAHRKLDSVEGDNGEVYMTYGSTALNIIDVDYTYIIDSGTEMYYSIDVDNLMLDEETGKYLVMIGTNGSENYGTTLALTNLKVSGYTVSFAEKEVQTAAEEGDVFSTPIVSEPAQVLMARREPPVNENMSIHSAVLKAAKVVSGKVATLNVKADTDAQTIVVTDADGNEVEATKCTRKIRGDEATFNFIWKVYGSRGDVLNFTIRVYDADGLASQNEETVAVTIK